jgi:hypothetical protein
MQISRIRSGGLEELPKGENDTANTAASHDEADFKMNLFY